MKLNVEFASGGDFSVDFGEIKTLDSAQYSGPYQVTPTGEAQTLYTANLRMDQNVTVQPIPYSEVSNTGGGKTAIIGGT